MHGNKRLVSNKNSSVSLCHFIVILLYSTLDALQADVDQWVDWYNRKRSHLGKHCYGKTPWQTCLDSLALAKEKLLNQLQETSDSTTCLAAWEK